jgi:hypothetical protein
VYATVIAPGPDGVTVMPEIGKLAVAVLHTGEVAVPTPAPFTAATV